CARCALSSQPTRRRSTGASSTPRPNPAATPTPTPLSSERLPSSKRVSAFYSRGSTTRPHGGEPSMSEETVNVRYMVDDVDAAVSFYTTHLGFSLISSAAPAFADVRRGPLRLLLSGPTSSAGRP